MFKITMFYVIQQTETVVWVSSYRYWEIAIDNCIEMIKWSRVQIIIYCLTQPITVVELN